MFHTTFFHNGTKGYPQKIVEVPGEDGVPGPPSESGALPVYPWADLSNGLHIPPKRSGLSGSVLNLIQKAGGPMLSVTGINRFYYLRGFTEHAL